MKSRSVRLDIVLVLVQDMCTVCAKRTIGSESFWTHPMVLLGDEAQVESCFGPFGESVSISARQVHSLFQTRLGNHFDRTR